MKRRVNWNTLSTGPRPARMAILATLRLSGFSSRYVSQHTAFSGSFMVGSGWGNQRSCHLP